MRNACRAAAAFALALILALPGSASAHRVNIFAWTEGPQVVTESGFSSGGRVRSGRVTVLDAVTGETLLEGRTDGKGLFRFPAPAAGRMHGLRIRIDAGEGHRNEWRMEPEELTGAAAPQRSPAAAPKASPAVSGNSASEPAPLPGNGRSAAAGPTPEELYAVMDAALEARLGPIRRELAELRTRRPGMTEIVGGIGWLAGLAGAALYFRRRRG